MSKKITSVLILVAAVLLSLSSYAQVQKRLHARSAEKQKMEMRTLSEGQKLTAAEMAKQKKHLQAKAAKEAEAASVNVVYNWGGAPRNNVGQQMTGLSFQPTHKAQFLMNRMGGVSNARFAATTDAHGIITSPDEGEHKFYTRAGVAYFYSGGYVNGADQSGHVEVVECADGTVYIKDIVSRYTQGAWVKGTKEGNTITVPAAQPVAYFLEYDATLSVNYGDFATNTYERGTGDITFTVDGNTISLNGTDAGERIIGIFWDDDNSWQGYGDYETVWTLDEDYTPAPTELVELPAGAEVLTWYNNGTDYPNAKKYSSTAQVAFVGDEVYVSGIFTEFPNSWIKGTVSGNTVTFAALQFLGVYNGTTNIFAIGATDSQVTDFVMTYDAEAQTLTSENLLFANAAEDRIYYLEGYTSIVLSQDKPEEPTAKTGENVDELPFAHELGEDVFETFGVLDANDDGATWLYGAQGTSCPYSFYNDADDWLVSPGVKLVAGKRYHFALDVAAYRDGAPERFEVKIAQEAKASVLAEGMALVAPTVVTHTGYETYEAEDFIVEETGYYYFGIHAISDANMWYLKVANFLVEEGADDAAPAAVENFTVTADGDKLAAHIAFTAPTTAINGTALAAGDITKIDVLRDGAVIKTFETPAPAAELTYTDDADDLSIGNHKYQVISYGETGIGGKSEVLTVFLSATLNVPATFNLTQQDVFSTFTVIDANEDGKTWNWSASYGTNYSYSSTKAGDDYLVSAGIQLEAGKAYKVSVVAKAYDIDYPEKLGVKVGQEPTVEGLTITAIPETVLTNDVEEELEGEFVAPEDGVYYVALHATSDPDMWRLYVSSLSIEKGPEPTAPAAPVISVEPGVEGALKANVTINVSSNAINGSALSGNLTTVELFCDGELLNTFENVAPGSTLTFVDEPQTKGTHVYQAVPYNESGVGQKSEKVTVFIGQDLPGNVENFEVVSTTANTVTFTWDPVKGANGGYINMAEAQYSVVALDIEEFWGMTFLVEGETLATVNATTATINYPVDEGDPEYKYFGVKAIVDGDESDATESYTYVYVGAPEELPIEESFADRKIVHIWFSNANTSLYVSDDASDGDGVALALTALNAGRVDFYTGKLNLKSAANATVLFDAKLGTGADKITIFGMTPDGVETDIETVTLTNDYQTFKVTIPASLKNERWAQVGLKAELAAGTNVLIDNVKILDLYEYDLSVAVSAPTSVLAGNAATITTTVKNEGENAATGYTVTIKAGEEVLVEETVNEALAPFATKVFTAEFATTIFDDAADVTITATVDYLNDLNEDNNAATTIISIKESTAAPVTTVTAEATDGGVLVGWTAPENSTEEVTEDVEAYEEFDTGGLGKDNLDEHYGQIGAWTVYDGNRVYGYGFSNITVPHMGDPNAWFVMNPGSSQISQDLSEHYPAHSGAQYFISSCVAEPETNIPDTDHWLISPELPGIAQTISFYACELVSDYGAEKFQILTSSTDTQVESFTLLQSGTVASTEWAEYSFDLPAGTKYFAIRHVSNDVWALLVDDITYTVGGGEIDHFNIYLDGEAVATAAADAATATLENVADGEHIVAVSVVYTNGQESKPVATNVTTGGTTGVNSITVITKPVDIYSLDGKLVRKQVITVEGLKGAYIVDGKKVILK